MEQVAFGMVALFAVVAGLGTLARMAGVPYPIFLVLGGLLLGFVPGVPTVELRPDVVLIIFLPPLLYYAAFFASPRELKADARPIALLSVGLVLLTTCAVAVVAHALIDGLPWPAAFVLGAVVSPTDPVAVTAIAQQLGVPRRLVTLIEGESLINDATALVAYRVAIAAAVGGGFSLLHASTQFVGGILGGVVIGLIVGVVIAEIRRRLDDPTIEITISLLTGYAAYAPAEHLHVSGVLATVTAGLYLGWKAPIFGSAEQRITGFSVWQILVFLLNATLFLLIGLQLRAIIAPLARGSFVALLGFGLTISAVVAALRVAWEFTVPYFIRIVDRRPGQRTRRIGPRERLVLGWSGMRGAVSLAAALAIPATLNGAPFPERNAIIFATFCVILTSIVGQGMTLPILIRRLGVVSDGEEERAEQSARLTATEAALREIGRMEDEGGFPDHKLERSRAQHRFEKRRLEAIAVGAPDDGLEDHSAKNQEMVRRLIKAQRDALIRLRNEGQISNEVMHRVEHELDLEELRLNR